MGFESEGIDELSSRHGLKLWWQCRCTYISSYILGERVDIWGKLYLIREIKRETLKR